MIHNMNIKFKSKCMLAHLPKYEIKQTEYFTVLPVNSKVIAIISSGMEG